MAVTLRLPPYLHTRLEQFAEADGKTLNEFLVDFLIVADERSVPIAKEEPP